MNLRQDRVRRRTKERRQLFNGTKSITVRHMHSRISSKCGRGKQTLALVTEDGTSQAEQLTRDWQPIAQPPPTDAAAQDLLFEQLPPACKPSALMAALVAPITDDDVRRAILGCPRGKASGPDGIPNDLYRDLVEEWTKAMTPRIAAWFEAAGFPPSSSAAHVYCIAKSLAPTSGLGCRPIALLNTDYKIITRILLERLRPFLPAMVASTQFGFVPGRQVHDAVDVWTAVQRLVATGKLPASVIAIMLHFAKAYDTLDRSFLLRALQWHGLPAHFIRVVEALHDGTTAAYLTGNGKSVEHPVTTGIRQGCPLAPTLFVLSVHLLYKLIDTSTLHGVPLSDTVSVTAVGSPMTLPCTFRTQRSTPN